MWESRWGSCSASIPTGPSAHFGPLPGHFFLPFGAPATPRDAQQTDRKERDSGTDKLQLSDTGGVGARRFHGHCNSCVEISGTLRLNLVACSLLEIFMISALREPLCHCLSAVRPDREPSSITHVTVGLFWILTYRLTSVNAI